MPTSVGNYQTFLSFTKYLDFWSKVRYREPTDILCDTHWQSHKWNYVPFQDGDQKTVCFLCRLMKKGDNSALFSNTKHL